MNIADFINGLNEMLAVTEFSLGVLGVFIVAQLADVYTTIRAIKAGASEGNGFIAMLMDKMGILWPIAKLAISLGAAWILHLEGRYTIIALLAVIILWVAWRNLRIAKSYEDMRR